MNSTGQPDVAFEDRQIIVGGRSWRVDYPVLDARLLGNRVVVLYDYTATKGLFQNLEAFSTEGKKLWTAENPSNSETDAYTNLIAMRPLTVGNWAGYTCRIDPESGRIMESVFTK